MAFGTPVGDSDTAAVTAASKACFLASAAGFFLLLICTVSTSCIGIVCAFVTGGTADCILRPALS